MIDARFNLLSALIISSLIFGFMHLTAVDIWTAIAISAEAGLMLAAAYKLRNNLWIPIGIHWAWNFMLGSIFGVDVSGFVEEYSLFIPQISGPYVLTGGNNGFEGSIVTLCVGVIVGLLLLYDKNMESFYPSAPSVSDIVRAVFQSPCCVLLQDCHIAATPHHLYLPNQKENSIMPRFPKVLRRSRW